MKRSNKHSEAGVALIMALLALLVLSAIAAALVYSTNTESEVNYNYKSEQVAYFAAKAGLEEARDRMMLGVSGNYYFANMTPNPLPTAAPTDSNNGILYIVNEGTKTGSVKPWDYTTPNAYMDDELCHDGYTLSGLPTGTSVPSPDLHCTTSQGPTTSTWYQTTTAQLPFNGTSAALAYKWVRVALKLNNSVQNYSVNPKAAANTLVCWNGVSEVTLNAASCAAMTPAATPVYLVTALAVSSTGARKMVQADVAPNPSTAFPYGLFGTGLGCGDVDFTGNGATDSFNSALGTYAKTKSNTGGDVGSNGNVTLTGNASIGGSVGAYSPTGVLVSGPCPGSNYTTSGNAGMASNPSNVLTPLATQVTVPIPTAPNPAPPETTTTYSSSASLVPGTYGNIKISGKATLTLAPGVYNINSVSVSGQGTITINPPGQVVLNVAGGGITSGNVIDLSGNSVNNPTLLANDFQIQYAGFGGINLSGNSDTYFVVDAPNAAVQISGNGDMFGAVVGKTILDSGNGTFHYDKAVSLAPPSTGALQLISFRHVAY